MRLPRDNSFLEICIYNFGKTLFQGAFDYSILYSGQLLSDNKMCRYLAVLLIADDNCFNKNDDLKIHVANRSIDVQKQGLQKELYLNLQLFVKQIFCAEKIMILENCKDYLIQSRHTRNSILRQYGGLHNLWVLHYYALA